MRPYPFVTVDVFTDAPFGGNPLAVLPDASGLGPDEMQRIAMEFNLSETAFVLPPRSAEHTAQVRIFTPRQEVPFAGHPNVGTAFALAQRGTCFGQAVGAGVVFEEAAGVVPVELLREGSATVGARLASPQPFAQGATLPVEVVAAATGLPAAAIDTADHAPCIGSCGLPFAFVRVAEAAALAGTGPVTDVFARDLPSELVAGVFLYAIRGAPEGVDIQARMFAPLHGVFEDPATGSANAALAGLLAALEPQADVDLERTVAQGVEMGRPSRLMIHAQKRAGAVRSTHVGGRCVPMLSGTLHVP